MTLAFSVTPDAPAERATPVVELENLVVDYVTRTRTTRAVDGVSLSIGAGEIVGLAGRVRVRQEHARERGDADPAAARAGNERPGPVRR